MGLTLLPAVDVANGRAVRPIQGRAANGSTAADPIDVVLSYQAAGAEWLHLVDLDAALGTGSNTALLDAVIDRLDVPVQLSGGIYDAASLGRALQTGCARVNLGTASLVDLDWCRAALATHGERLAVGLDVAVVAETTGRVVHRLVPRGGSNDVGDLWEALDVLDEAGCSRYVVTDVSRDGTRRGPNLALVLGVARATRARVIASGGVGSVEDLDELTHLATEAPNVEGVVLGTALHDGALTFAQALDAVAERRRVPPE